MISVILKNCIYPLIIVCLDTLYSSLVRRCLLLKPKLALLVFVSHLRHMLLYDCRKD